MTTRSSIARCRDLSPVSSSPSTISARAFASTSNAITSLPPLESLLTWVHRPQAMAKCHISDLYAMRSLVAQGQETLSYASREVFLLNQFPCKMVEMVAWVAGVDHKESSMTITLDDGGGDHVLPVLVRLTLIKPTAPLPSRPSKTNEDSSTSARSFQSVRERIAKRKAEALNTEIGPKRSLMKVYNRPDVRVGDTIRVIGKVDEWQRRKSTGEVEWVRQVTVEEGAGGSVVVVDPDVQYLHAAQVYELHQSTYSRPFRIPDIVPRSQPSTPGKSLPRFVGSIEPSSEAPSELTIADEHEPELRDPDRLRSSQLTDRTFRHYMLDHTTQETIRALREIAADGPNATRAAIEAFFPEYQPTTHKAKYSTSSLGAGGNGVFAPSTRYNSLPDECTTPRRTSFGTRKATVAIQSPTTVSSKLQPFTIACVLADDRLARLARLVVDSELRKEEKRRRRRLRDGQATKRDLAIEAERQERGLGSGRDYLGTISDTERRGKMEKLVNWVIRSVAEEGSLVQVRLIPTHEKRRKVEYGYLPIPPQLLFPLLVPHLQAERALRRKTIRRKNDPKTGHGMVIDELVSKLRVWGEEGRWERVGDWKVEESIEWAHERGLVIKEGNGWWLVDDHVE